MIIERINDGFTALEDLLSLILAAFAYMEPRIDPPSSAHLLNVSSLREKAATEIAYVAVEQGQILGCVFLNPEPDCLYIGKLAIDPTMQGRGIGRALLDTAIHTAETLGLPQLRLQTRIELIENHAIFSRWGFRTTAERAHPGFTRATYIEMRKAL
ncbi:N-acetylglutamate synthase-like GNAT family acetyltransferase [Pararhizobium capsulatum DSM 1112]|uniref:N-acetylglutamate synthase-like GNAT family acetyltransferase n=1 Tax=Pararhizobium capsulatum DSM 1112 TaxID=1121113 RepID=A0ABU0BJB6_9HYPH|nr:GNAT family N-acetyltransferase [Pararhizobium capsulatum]MDQ0318344.1 N-acetylglutamate synthase-like GNAT family acetyltransferase [Pararhizobium capsulatum DSM 1112]